MIYDIDSVKIKQQVKAQLVEQLLPGHRDTHPTNCSTWTTQACVLIVSRRTLSRSH